MIIGPYEADRLIPTLESHSVVHLHIYAPQTTKTLISFENLQFYTIPVLKAQVSQPETTIQELCLFAGSLYLRDYTRYQRLCSFLGITVTIVDDAENLRISVDRFVDRNSRAQIGWPTKCPFDKCQIPFFNTLISIRMRGQRYLQSHLGSLVNGRLLTENSFS